MNKKILIILVAIVVIIISIFGNKLFNRETKSVPALTKVSVALDWFPWSNHSGLFIAQERGYFAQEGLGVTIFTPADSTTVLQTVAAGRDDFGISFQTEVLLARGQKVPVVSIMVLVQHPLNSIMALKESGIAEPRDLVGKKVGWTGSPQIEPMVDTMLKSQGKSLKDVELVNVGFDMLPALLSKRVDAIAGAYWVHESISAAKQGFPVNIMRIEQYGVTDFYELVLVTNEEKIAKESEIVQRFVRATKRGYDDAMKDPEAAVQLMKKIKPEVDLDIDIPGVKLLAPLWRPENGIFGWQEEKRWLDFGNWMKENDLISKDLDVKAAFNNSFVENAAKGK